MDERKPQKNPVRINGLWTEVQSHNPGIIKQEFEPCNPNIQFHVEKKFSHILDIKFICKIYGYVRTCAYAETGQVFLNSFLL